MQHRKAELPVNSRTAPIRVFQVATGNVGSEMIRRYQQRDDLELVGVHCYSPEKVGRDVGGLVGIGPIGVTATGSIDEVIAAAPDVLTFHGVFPDEDLYVPILEAGINIVTTADWITGWHRDTNHPHPSGKPVTQLLAAIVLWAFGVRFVFLWAVLTFLMNFIPYVGTVFGYGLPAIFAGYVTGGITAAGGAWNASIVAEVVTYRGQTLTATGLGSYITAATADGDWGRILVGVMVMSMFVVGTNRTLWRRLYVLAERRYSPA